MECSKVPVLWVRGWAGQLFSGCPRAGLGQGWGTSGQGRGKAPGDAPQGSSGDGQLEEVWPKCTASWGLGEALSRIHKHKFEEEKLEL